MRSTRLVVAVLSVQLLMSGIAAAEDSDQNSGAKVQPGWNVLAAANAGFTALRVAEQVTKDVAKVAPDGSVTKDPDHVEIIANTRYSIAPAISSSVLFWYEGYRHIGFGVSGDIVTVSQDSGPRIAPAITMHFGAINQHVYLGGILLPADEVNFPNGKRSAIVDASNIPDFTTKQTGKAIQWYFGISLIGTQYDFSSTKK